MIHMTNNELLEFKKHRTTLCLPVLHDKLIDCAENLGVFYSNEKGRNNEPIILYAVETEDTLPSISYFM